MNSTERVLYISGKLRGNDLTLNGDIKVKPCRFAGKLMCNNMMLEGSLSLGGDILPYYEGAYVVTPKVREQELETANKSMTTDVLVESIPYTEVSNPSGGMTITIGEL